MRVRVALLPAILLAASFAFAQAPDVITANENLVVEGVAPVPREIAERANRYTESRSAGLVGWHPLKREMLISTRFADTNQLHHVKFPGGARTQLTFFPDRVSSGSFHPHKGDYFIFGKDIGGGEWYQIFRDDTSSGDVTLLTDGKSRNLGARWSNAGDRIAYASTRRNRADLDFYVMNPTDKASDKLLSENQGGGWDVADWSPDDTTLLATEYISINESYIWLVDSATGKKTLLTPKGGEKVAYSPIGFSADAKGIYLTTDNDNEFLRLAHMDLATKKLTYLTDYKWDVDSGVLSWNRKMLAFTVNENGMSTLHVLDLVTGKERKLPALPVGLVSGLEWHENDRDLGFMISWARSPSDVYSVDITTGKLDRWTESETGGLNAQNFAEPELIKWKAADGLQLSGYLYRPNPAKFPGARPVMVNIHGGPESQFRPGFLARFNYFLNELGAAIIFPNVRGSIGYGKTFALADNGFKREGSYEDIKALLAWIKSQPTLDGNRILVGGGSYGGHMTLAVATRYNDMICCSVNIVGMSSLVTFLEHTEAYRRDLRRVEYGDERDPKMREFLERIAPIKHVKNITRPLFVIQGANDPRVPKSEADQMVAALRQNGTPVWYVVAKDEGHGFAKKKNADYQFYATILFVQKYLLGSGETTATAK